MIPRVRACSQPGTLVSLTWSMGAWVTGHISKESRANGCSIAFKLKRTHPDRYCFPAGTALKSVGNTVGNTGEVRPLPHGRIFFCRGLTSFHLHKFLAPAFEIADDSSVTFTSVRNELQASMVQNSFSSWSVEASLWVSLPFSFRVSILTRLLQWWRFRWIYWRCEGQWRSIIRGSR